MSVYQVRTNYSRGYVVEFVDFGDEPCSSWLLFPAENLWPHALRGFLYILALLYMFIGVAIASDAFMCSIEVITSKKRKVIRWDEERQEKVEREVLLWNETVANLTLMALGSSAPEILLATVESISKLDSSEAEDALGTFTIIGSAAFNLMMITAVCVVSVPTGEVKSIKEVGVFIVTSIWSIWAYIWMLLVVKYISSGVVDPWEAWITLAFLPMFVLIAYAVDTGCCCAKKVEGAEVDDEGVRVIGHQHPAQGFARPKELRVLEAERAHRMSDKAAHQDASATHVRASAADRDHRSSAHVVESHVLARARFRHAAVSALTGHSGRVSSVRLSQRQRGSRMADVVSTVQDIQNAIKQGKPPPKEYFGKFTFASDRYEIEESAGHIRIDVLFHRRLMTDSPVRKPSDRGRNAMAALKNGAAGGGGSSIDPEYEGFYPGVVTVDFETREATAKAGKDFKYSSGTLTFKETEYLQSIQVPIINDTQYEADVDFYIILKNPTGGAGLGDPSVTRITILDDDEPGEFMFEEAHYHADMKKGKAVVKVIRQHGYDGKVTVEYSTIDGTARGGATIGQNVDYAETHGTVAFEHKEMSKTITVDINKSSQGSKNFIIALRNPSLGAKIGQRSAAVIHLNKDELMERVGEVLEDDEEENVTWTGQFIQAMTLSPEKDDDGKEVQPTWVNYLMHFLTFFWKLVCACIPPTHCLGAYPSFVCSLIVIGAMTAVIEQLGGLLGCVTGLKTSVTGITIIALGTSLPDTFASRTAATQDEHADAAIGNITGSNSVNVFLGLGLPWVLSTMYKLAKGRDHAVLEGNLAFSVYVFTGLATVTVISLLIRRKVTGGELGGKTAKAKWLYAMFLVLLWVTYIILASLKAYGYLG